MRINSVSFGSTATKADKLATSVFKKIAHGSDGKLKTYLGTTLKGDNVTIRETNFGKSADLYISYAQKSLKKPDKFDIFHIDRTSDKPVSITSIDGNALKNKEISKVQSIINTLI